MKFSDFVNKNVNEEVDIQTSVSPQNTDLMYWNIKNPDTGLRYDIPLLVRTDPEYMFKYIHYMKIRETSPETFEKILNWD